MRDFLTGLALVLVIEGALYALFPQPMRRAALALVGQPENLLRAMGLGAACVGVAGIWLLRHH